MRKAEVVCGAEQIDVEKKTLFLEKRPEVFKYKKRVRPSWWRENSSLKYVVHRSVLEVGPARETLRSSKGDVELLRQYTGERKRVVAVLCSLCLL